MIIFTIILTISDMTIFIFMRYIVVFVFDFVTLEPPSSSVWISGS
jgi:hypothetical protein